MFSQSFRKINIHYIKQEVIDAVSYHNVRTLRKINMRKCFICVPKDKKVKKMVRNGTSTNSTYRFKLFQREYISSLHGIF